MDSDLNFEDYEVEEVFTDEDTIALKVSKPSKPEGVGTLVTLPVKQGTEPEPEPGDDVRLYRHPEAGVCGADVNGENFFYVSVEEKKRRKMEKKKEIERKKKQEFEEKRGELDKQYEELPKPFQKRIDRFRRNNPDFRWKYEEYELFVCREAVKIAETLETLEAVKEFRKASIEEQFETVDLEEGHSGNTFHIATKLAYLYLDEPGLVVEMHGAMAPLVGSEEYGGAPKN